MTGQKYVQGRGNTTLIEQTVEKSTSAANSTAQTSHLSDDSVQIYADVFEVQERLLDVVDSFLQTVSPISAVNRLLEHWLTTSPADLSSKANARQLDVVLQLVNFLVDLKDCDDALKTIIADKKEVSRG